MPVNQPRTLLLILLLLGLVATAGIALIQKSESPAPASLATATPAVPTAASETTAVALLRTDGVLLPFAVHASKQWVQLPFDSIPAWIHGSPATWYYISADSGHRPITRAAPFMFDAGSSDAWYEPWGVATNLPSQLWFSGYPIRRVGAAISRQIDATSFVESADSVLNSRVLTLLTSLNDTLDARDATSTLLQSVLDSRRSPSGIRLLHGVARRTYAPPEGETCEAVVFLQAWFAVSDAGVAMLSPEVLHSNCTEMNARIATPYALFELEGSHYVAAEWTLYEATERDVLKVSPTEVTSVLHVSR